MSWFDRVSITITLSLSKRGISNRGASPSFDRLRMMGLGIAFLFTAFVMAGLFAPVSAASKNLLVNGGFSGELGANGCAKGWKSSGPVTLSLLSGNQGEEIDERRGYFPGLGRYVQVMVKEPSLAYVYQDVNPSRLAGKYLLLECMVKITEFKAGTGSDTHARASVELGRTNGERSRFERKFTATGEWEIVRIVTQAPSDLGAVRIWFGFDGASGKLKVRDVGLHVVEKPVEIEVEPGVKEIDYGNGFRQMTVDGKTWYDRSETDTPLSVDTKFTEREKSRGFVVFQRGGASVLPAINKPIRKEIIRESDAVSLSVCADELRGIPVAIYPLREMKNARFEIGSLESKRGDVLPAGVLYADYFETGFYRTSWYAEYARMARVLHRFDTIDIPPGNGAQFRIYCQPPADAKPGVYTGKVVVKDDSGASLPINLKVTVRPFKLDPMPLHWSMYYYYDPDDALSDQLAMMKELGMTSVIYSPPRTSMEARLSLVDGKVKFDFGPDDEFMKAYKAAGYEMPVLYYPRLVLLRLVQLHGLDKQFKQEWFLSGWNPVIPKAEDYPPQVLESYKQFLRMVVQRAKEANWPETILYLTDEPDPVYDYTVAEAIASYKASKEVSPETSTFCTMYFPQSMPTVGKYLDFISCQGLLSVYGMPRNKQLLDACKQSGSELWASEWPGLFRNNYWYNRAFAGLVCAKSGFQGMNIWYWVNSGKRKASKDPIHISVGPVTIDWSLTKKGNDIGGCGLSLYGQNARGGLDNSVQMEGLRDGILDYRYIATLKNAIARAKAKNWNVSKYDKELARIIDSAPTLKLESIYKCDRPGLTDAGGWTVDRNNELIERLARAIVEVDALAAKRGK